jgi:hypothetical protein
MTKCSLCGDERKNIIWFVNDKPACKKHHDMILHISTAFDIVGIKFEQRMENDSDR